MKIIKYSARVLSIIIFLFFGMFILEGFSQDFGWQDGLMHGVLALGVLGALAIAWKWPKIGGWLFILFGLRWLFPVFMSNDGWNGVLIGGIPLLTGILFLIDGFRKTKQ